MNRVLKISLIMTILIALFLCFGGVFAKNGNEYVIELETKIFESSAGAVVTTGTDNTASYAAISTTKKDGYVEFDFDVQNTCKYDMNIFIRFTSATGSYYIYLDDTQIYKKVYHSQSADTKSEWHKLELSQHVLNAGSHKIKIVSTSAVAMSYELDRLYLCESKNITSYVVDGYNGGNFTDFDCDDNNAQYTEYYSEPYPALIIKMSSANKSVEYNMDVEHEGYYTLGFIAKYGPNNDVFRVYVDNTIVQSVDMTARSGWHNVTLAEIYLKKGKHTIKFVSPGEKGVNRVILSSIKLTYEDSVKRELATSTDVMTQIYVSPEGNDSNNGTKNSPLKTIEAALDRARQLCLSMTGNIEIVLKDGTYVPGYTEREIPLYSYDYKKDEKGNIISSEKNLNGHYNVKTSNIIFDNSLSPADGYKIIIKADDGAEPVISGAQQISGWTLHDSEKNIYVANANGVDTRQLFVNGNRATRARSNFDFEMQTNVLGEYEVTETGYSVSNSKFLSWKNIQDVEFVYLKPDTYYAPRVHIESIAPDNKYGVAITMKSPAWNCLSNLRMTDSHYLPSYIENAYELLDEEGEWYLDKSSNKIYYKPFSSENMATAEVFASVIDELVTIEGNSASDPVGNIEFNGVTFSGTTWLRPNTANGHIDAQSNLITEELTTDYNYEIPISAITVTNAFGINFKNCAFTKLGSNGINFHEGSSDVVIEGNRFTDISGTALVVGGTSSDYRHVEQRDKVLRNFDINNNYFEDIAVEYFTGVAIAAGLPNNLTISHNEISNTRYSAIHIGWGLYSLDEENSAFGYGLMRDVDISNNCISNTNMFLRDGAPIYVRGKVGTSDINPNEIKGNYISKRSTMGYGGVYFDCGLGCWYADNNLVTDVDVAFFGQSVRDRFIGDNNYANYRIKAVGDYAKNANDRVNTVYGVLPQAAKQIAANAGLKSEYRHLSSYSEGELFNVVPSETMYYLNTSDTLTVSLVATDIFGNEIDTDDLNVEYFKGTYFNKRNFELSKIKNGKTRALTSCADYTVNENNSITFRRPQHTAFWVRAEKDGVSQYAYVMVQVGNAKHVSEFEVAVDENSSLARSTAFPYYDYPNFGGVGSYIEYDVNFEKNGLYRLSLGNVTRDQSNWKNNKCIVSVSVDGEILNEQIDLFKENLSSTYIGEIAVKQPGVKKIRFTCIGKNSEASFAGMRMAIECLYMDSRGEYNEVSINGRDNLNAGQGVMVKLTDADDNYVYYDYANCDEDGYFKFLFSTKDNSQKTYDYTLYFMGSQKSATGQFTVCPQNSDDVVMVGYVINGSNDERAKTVFGESFKASVRLKNLTADSEFIVAQYDKDDNMLAITSGNSSTEKAARYTEIKSKEITPEKAAHKIYVFLWRKDDSLMPVIKNMTYDLSDTVEVVVSYNTEF